MSRCRVSGGRREHYLGSILTRLRKKRVTCLAVCLFINRARDPRIATTESAGAPAGAGVVAVVLQPPTASPRDDSVLAENEQAGAPAGGGGARWCRWRCCSRRRAPTRSSLKINKNQSLHTMRARVTKQDILVATWCYVDISTKRNNSLVQHTTTVNNGVDAGHFLLRVADASRRRLNLEPVKILCETTVPRERLYQLLDKFNFFKLSVSW